MKINEKLSILLMLENSRASKDGMVPIYVRLTVDSKRAEFSLGQKVHPDRWNQEGNCAKGCSKEARDINSAIDKAKTKLRQVDDAMVNRNYQQIKQDIKDIVQTEISRLLSDPSTEHLVIRK